ncbi:MAG: CHAT domain-containing protein [Lapillicoccus sp.]
MAAWEYDNFDLLIETEDNGEFRARVIDSPTRECPTSRFRIPFDPTRLENLLLKLDPGRSGTRRVAADPQSQAALELGSGLFDAVFTDDIRLTWARSIDMVRAAKRGLRLRLRLTEAPSIAVLPWELLYDRRQHSFIAQSERTPVVRYLEVPLTPRALDIDAALRILVVVSSPTDLPELDVEAEWRRVEAALADRVSQGTVHVDRLEQPTLQALSAWIRHHDVHVLHFIGHGEYDRQLQDGVLYFCDRYGRRAPVSSSVIGPYLRDHDPLRLVFLNACQSARVDSADPFSGMAQGLVQQDCVAVVAMQFPISDGAAAEFTGEFYGSLADGLAVDQSVTSGRKALLAGYAAEWATPVLFLRDPEGKVFDHIVPAAAVSSAVGPAEAAPTALGAGLAGVAVGDPAVDAAATGVEASAPAALAAGAATNHGTTVDAADSTEVLAALRMPPPRADTAAAGSASATAATTPLPTTPATTSSAGSGASTTPPETVKSPTKSTPPATRLAGRIVAIVLVLGLLGYLGWWFAQRPGDDNGNATPSVTTTGSATTTGGATTTTEAPPVVSKQVTVSGTQAWTDAGVACQPGKRIELNATGTVFHIAGKPAGPDGDPNPDLRKFNLPGLPDANHSALVASLDAKAPFTVIGSSATYQCQAAGELLFGPNDGGLDNNSGEWTVTVTPSG